MPPKVKFTRELVIEIALQSIEAFGPEALSTRRVAKALGGSQAPIYRLFENMDGLRESVLENILQQLKGYCQRDYNPDAFMNTGIGYVLFAKEHRHLFELLSSSPRHYGQFRDFVRQGISRLNYLQAYGEKRLTQLVEVLSIYSYGLVLGMYNGLVEIQGSQVGNGADDQDCIKSIMAYFNAVAGPLIIAFEHEVVLEGGHDGGV